MPTIETTYSGDLRTEAIHLKSGKKIITDAPVDNHGKGEAFSPTDLLSASLGSCMLTIMGIAADRYKINMKGTHVKITKIMGDNPRRVTEIIIDIEFPSSIPEDKTRRLLEVAAINCPVAKSLHPEIKQRVNFIYPS